LIDALGAAGIGPTGLRETGTVPALGVHRFLAIEGRDSDGPSRRSDRRGGPSGSANDHRRASELASPSELTIEELADDPGTFDVVRIMQEERPRDEGAL
jgi:hypothetical protein